MRILLFLIAAQLSFSAISQVEDITYEMQKGKKYIVHIAQAGNTLWGIHNTYNVTVEEIVALNPGVEKGVVEGQKILIPAGAAFAKYPDGTLIKEHIVVKGETLYKLATREGSSMDEIVKLNPSVAEGLKVGEMVRIPIYKQPTENKTGSTAITDVPKPEVGNKPPVKPVVAPLEFADTTIQHTVTDTETLYSISKRFMIPVADLQTINQLKTTKIKPGDVLKIPIKKEKAKAIEIRKVEPVKEVVKKVDEELLFKKKDEYLIAVMLPFYLDGGEGASTSLKNLATEFYMGMELAIDSLEKLGFKAKIHVYDAKNDSASVLSLLKKPEMKQMDLVFGPLFPQGADIVGTWCKANKIRMVCPSACNTTLLKDNQFVYAAVTSDVTQQRILAKYTLDNHKNDQIVLVNTGIAKDKELYDAFRNRFLELSNAKDNVKLIEIKTEELAAYIKKGGNTVFVVPTRDKGSATKFMNTLQKSSDKSGSGTISVFGTKDWSGFDDITGYQKNKFNLHWATSSDLNYTLPETKRLLRKYRSSYKADMSRYGAHGFDVVYYFSSSLLMQKKAIQGVINAFDMEQVSPGNGYENNQCFIVKHADYEVVRVGLVHE